MITKDLRPLRSLVRLLKSFRRQTLCCQVPIHCSKDEKITDVDSYWESHTVNSKPFYSAKKSLEYLEWRWTEYPLFKEFMELYGSHENEVVLDYGCGPGNDLTGFLTHSKAKKIIGIDVSLHALKLASHRLSLHKEHDLSRLKLIHKSDSNTSIPLESNSVDHLYCEGVLQHTSDPKGILKEFYRILKIGASANVMVYNKNSLWLHLYVAYEKLILNKEYPHFTAEEAFSRYTDGENCPLARCWDSIEFTELCKEIGFKVNYVGGYLSRHEMEQLAKHYFKALSDKRLPERHRQFLRTLTFDVKGYPLYEGKHSGIGSVYKLLK